jgi:uncharacterized protein (DUF58 family)
MAGSALALHQQLPAADLTRLSRILARHLGGRPSYSGSGHSAGRRGGQSLDFLDYSAYQPGDDIRRIDWRASARANAIQTRRYTDYEAADWTLCLDASASMRYGSRDKWSQACLVTAAIAYVALSLGHRVALALFSDSVESWCCHGRGHSQYARIVGSLENHSLRPRGAGSEPGCCLAVTGRRDRIVVVSDFLADQAMIPGLEILGYGERELRLLRLASDTDVQPPPRSKLSVFDVESGECLQLEDLDTAGENAAYQREQLAVQLSQWAQRNDTACTHSDIHEPWQNVLLRHFMAVA